MDNNIPDEEKNLKFESSPESGPAAGNPAEFVAQRAETIAGPSQPQVEIDSDEGPDEVDETASRLKSLREQLKKSSEIDLSDLTQGASSAELNEHGEIK